MRNIPELCLGSAQIGLDYGVSNKTGKIKKHDLEEIFILMRKNNIKFIDTAKNYGDAEKIIGDNLFLTSSFDVITKLDVTELKNISYENIEDLKNLIVDSLCKLKKNLIYGVLIHNPQSLNIKSSEIIIDYLNQLKKKGLIKKVGISIYNRKDLEIFDLKKIDIVQLPLSIYDQRLIKDGTLKILSKNNIDIHVRSIFLQGLILEKPNKWPSFINDSFKDHHQNFSIFLSENSITPLEATFIFLNSLNGIDSVIVGISNKKELQDICNAWNNASKLKQRINKFQNWAWDEKRFLDPRNWP